MIWTGELLGVPRSGLDEIDVHERLALIGVEPRVFSDIFETPIRQAKHGDSSGVRGAAWLWPPDA